MDLDQALVGLGLRRRLALAELQAVQAALLGETVAVIGGGNIGHTVRSSSCGREKGV